MLELAGRRSTPHIPQSEASECGLACIAMVAAYHGLSVDLVTLRRRFELSLKGATLKQLMLVAEALGFNARPLRGEIEDLPHLSLPAVLHWDLSHYVVLTKISEGLGGYRYHINDPAKGTLKLTREEFSRHFTGVALDMLKAESFKPSIESSPLRIAQLWSSMTGFWMSARQVLVLSIIMQIVVLASPLFMRTAIDTVFPSFDYDLLMILAIGFAGLALINYLATWLRSLVLLTLNNSLSYQVVVNLFRHLMRLPLTWFEKRHVGDVIQRFNSTQPIAQLLSQGMIAGFVDGVLAILTLTLMFVYSGVLSLISLGALSIYIAVRLGFLEALRLRSFDSITAAARENSTFIESIRGIAAIKAFGKEGERQRLWQRKKAEAVNAQIKLGRLTGGFDASSKIILDLENVLFVYVAISLALDAKLTLGMLFAFQAYKQQFLSASMRLIEQAVNFKIVQLHLARISDIALTRKEDGDEAPREAPDFAQPFELRDIRYRYGVGESEVLKGVSLTIEPGEMVAFVGPSGGGKTTLMKIMMGVFEPTYGEVLIGSRPASTFGKQAYRQAIGSIAQDDTLFAGSLAENIAFFDPEIDMDRVEEVARLAYIHDDIDKMPLRYDTLVGDMGSTLSGGQKQRVLLARALYARPQILFIDEGTAHLDPETESKILASLNEQKITRIMIAHRSQSISAARRVYVVNNGKIAAFCRSDPAPLNAA